MEKKCYDIGGLFKLRIMGHHSIFENIEEYYPNILELDNTSDYDYQLIIEDTLCIECSIFDKDSTLIKPFRNSIYSIKKSGNESISYATKQEFSDHNAIVRKNKDIFLFAPNDPLNFNVIRIIGELTLRKLLEKKYFPIHASCVVKDNNADLYFGPKGSGKSTALLCSVILNNYNPLANDIVFVGKENDCWKVFGTVYDLTFDRFFLQQFKEEEFSPKLLSHSSQNSDNKFRFTPKKFCTTFNTKWVLAANLKNIYFCDLNPQAEFVSKIINPSVAINHLEEYGKDFNFTFDDLLSINDLVPNFDYVQLASDIEIRKNVGNILNYKRKI